MHEDWSLEFDLRFLVVNQVQIIATLLGATVKEHAHQAVAIQNLEVVVPDFLLGYY